VLPLLEEVKGEKSAANWKSGEAWAVGEKSRRVIVE
jgi:hypothetical protein